MILPSKELIQEVLVINGVSSVRELDSPPNYIEYDSTEDYKTYFSYRINIYELQHKMKEWALDRRFIVTTIPCLTEKKWRHNSVRLLHFHNIGIDRQIEKHHPNKRFEAPTEFEAVVKACEFILKENNE